MGLIDNIRHPTASGIFAALPGIANDMAARPGEEETLTHLAQLAASDTPEEAIKRLLPTIRADFYLESDQIRDAGFGNVELLRETAAPEDNARALSRFLSIPEARALDIARTDHLFSD